MKNIMPRPRSQDKRDAILDAATKLIAERGLAATRTSAISQAAGIAEGTLFTYFSTKDELVKALYLELKAEMVEVLVTRLPRQASPQEQIRFLWDAYLDWGIASPEKRRVNEQFQVAPEISPEFRAEASVPLAEIEQLLVRCIEQKILRDYPVAFIGATLLALAESTITFMQADPSNAARYRSFGFEMLWNAVATQ